MLHRFGLLFCLWPAVVPAQTSQIVGRVSDPAGRAVEGATLTAIDAGTSQQRTVTTNDRGDFAILLLRPAEYSLRVERAGFQTATANITLKIHEVARADFLLALATVHEQVSVVANAQGLEPETASLGHLVQDFQLLGLPLLGRNPYSLGMLLPGVRTVLGMNNLPTDAGAQSAVSINGGRNNMNAFLLDGAPNTSSLQNQAVIFANVDSVQEFKIEANNFSAEYGRSAGGVFNVATRSGSNDLHFTAFEFLRNRVFNANDWFANTAGQPAPAFRLNQFGGVIGGPLNIPHLYRGRNRTFFFLSTELVRFAQGITFTGTVPTPQQLSGDFSQLMNARGGPITIYDPLTAAENGGSLRSPFPGKVIPSNRIDPVARNAAMFWPAPNGPGVPYTGTGNFVRTDANYISKNSLGVRADHNFSPATRLFLRYSYDHTQTTFTPAYGPKYIASPGASFQDLNRYNAVTEIDRIFSPAFAGVLRLSFSRFSNMTRPLSFGFDISELEFPQALRSGIDTPSFPVLGLNGYNVLTSPQASVLPTLGNSNTAANISNDYVLAANATRVIGSHVLKLGGESRLIQLNISGNNMAAGFNFGPGFTQGPNPISPAADAGSSVAAFLLGAMAGGSVNNTTFLSLQARYAALFVEDRWNLAPHLTLNLGMRYDYETPRTERFDRLANLDLSSVSPLGAPASRGTLAFPGVHGAPRYQSDPDRNNFAPRMGLAWRPFSRTVIRAGGGIFYAPGSGLGGATSAYGVAGFEASTAVVASLDGVMPATYLSNPFPQGLNRPSGNALGPATLLGQDIKFYDRGNRVPYAAQWNLDVQQLMPGAVVLDVAYVGTRGLHFPVDREWNQIPDSLLTLGMPLSQSVPNPFFGQLTVGSLAGPAVQRAQLLRPYPQFGQVTSMAAAWSASRYHALQVKLERRYRNALSLLFSYTYSKSMNDSSGRLVGGETLADASNQDWNNLRGDWATSVLDQTHRAVFSSIYTLPSWKGKGLVSKIIGGWEAGLIVSWFTGAPVSVFTLPDLNGPPGGGTRRPNWTGVNPGIEHPGPSRWLDISQFSAPQRLAFGNAPRTFNGVRTDGVRNLDFALIKTLAIREKLKLQIRGESFNLLNRPQFGPPYPAFGTAQFGSVVAMENQPRVFQVGAKIVY